MAKATKKETELQEKLDRARELLDNLVRAAEEQDQSGIVYAAVAVVLFLRIWMSFRMPLSG